MGTKLRCCWRMRATTAASASAAGVRVWPITAASSGSRPCNRAAMHHMQASVADVRVSHHCSFFWYQTLQWVALHHMPRCS